MNLEPKKASKVLNGELTENPQNDVHLIPEVDHANVLMIPSDFRVV